MKRFTSMVFKFACMISLGANCSGFAQKGMSSMRMDAPMRIRVGDWRGTLVLNDSVSLPFSFTTVLQATGYRLIIHNSTENIAVEELVVTKDSINWHMPVFDSWFKCKIDSMGGFHGTFFNRAASKPYDLKFRAEYNLPRFDGNKYPNTKNEKLIGKWECAFSPETADSSKAIGLFSAENPRVLTGTFLTETGDYRFLEGEFTLHDSFVLSTFDGSHCFFFKAHLGKDGMLHGNAWYGKFGYENWMGKRNEKFQLRDAEKLTWVKDSSNVNFTFNDINGNPVSLSDPNYKGKVVILQIMGSWCPNCMDETQWLTEMNRKYHDQGLEIIALGYERSTDTAKSNASIRRVKDHFGATYTFLNTGMSGKNSASESLPFLNGIMSFPTSIYIDRNGKVRMIYTGFNGPATGAVYEKDTAEIERLIQQMLSEKK